MDEKKVTKFHAVDASAGDFKVQHYEDGDVMISQTGGFDGRERVFIPAGMYEEFMKAMARPPCP